MNWRGIPLNLLAGSLALIDVMGAKGSIERNELIVLQAFENIMQSVVVSSTNPWIIAAAVFSTQR